MQEDCDYHTLSDKLIRLTSNATELVRGQRKEFADINSALSDIEITTKDQGPKDPALTRKEVNPEEALRTCCWMQYNIECIMRRFERTGDDISAPACGERRDILKELKNAYGTYRLFIIANMHTSDQSTKICRKKLKSQQKFRLTH